MKRMASYIRLHNNVYVPGAGELGNTFPSPGKSLEDLKITVMGADGYIVEFSFKGHHKEVHLPAAAVAVADLIPAKESK